VADARTLPVLSESKRLRFFSLTAFYFAQGVPIGLLNVALPAWLAEQGHSPAEIGTFVAAIGLPWAFKLVAGPFMDRYQFPAMGIRRPWVMGAQAGLMLALATLGLAPGGEGQFYALLAIGTLANSFAATQDVAVDGLAINVLPHREQGRANALMMFGQVVGTGVFGGLSGVLLAHAGLPTTALVAAAAVLVVFLVSLLARERPGERLLPWTAGEARQPLAPPAGSLFSIFGNLLTALCLPMSLLLMLATVLARVSTGMTLVIYPVFAVNELGYDAEAYSQVVSVVYTTAAFAGLAVGPLVDRAGPKRVLTVSLVFIAMVFGAFSVTPALWGSGAYVLVMVMLAEVGIQAFTIAVIAQHMNITWIKVAATQFAVYMAVANLGRSGGAAAFSVLSGILELHQIFMVMAALSLLAAVALVPFHQSRHHQRLRLLAEPVP
jgi:PAT family beta-lactamase induction signal transducer AmpG